MDKSTKSKGKNVFVLRRCLDLSGYFSGVPAEDLLADRTTSCRMLLHFLMCFQFNTHMVEGVFANRLISTHDVETRIWKEAEM